MKNKNLNNDFYSELAAQAIRIRSLATKDKAALLVHGIDDAWLSRFDRNVSCLKSSSDNDQQVRLINTQTRMKNESAANLKTELRRLAACVRDSYGITSVEYLSLGDLSFTHIRNTELIHEAGKIRGLLSAILQSENAPCITEQDVEMLDISINQLAQSLLARRQQLTDRDVLLLAQRNSANELLQAIRFLSKKGQTYWKDIDTVRFNEYVIRFLSAHSVGEEIPPDVAEVADKVA